MYDTLLEVETTYKSSIIKHTLTYNTSNGIEICTLAVNTAIIRKTFNGSMAIIDMLESKPIYFHENLLFFEIIFIPLY